MQYLPTASYKNMTSQGSNYAASRVVPCVEIVFSSVIRQVGIEPREIKRSQHQLTSAGFQDCRYFNAILHLDSTRQKSSMPICCHI